MQHTALIYLGQRFIYRVVGFLYHWYVAGTRAYWHGVVELFERMDHTLAWNITRKHLFKPLYGDYSVVGYILGFIFRIGRLCGASIVYIILFLILAGAYIIWLLIPFTLVVKIVFG